MKRGLVLEGGAFRGLFTSGIIDVMMAHDVWPDGLIGVSAGAAFGCNYKSRQTGRAIRYNKAYAHDPRYSGIRSLLTTGDYFNAQFAYHTMPRQLDVFDNEAFNANPMQFYAVCTDVETGKAVYKHLEQASDTTYDWIRASASMPLVSRVIRLHSPGVFRKHWLRQKRGHPHPARGLSEGAQQADAPTPPVIAQISQDD